MGRDRHFQGQLSEKMRWITFWKDLQLAIKWVQANGLDLYFSAKLKSSVSSGSLGGWGLKQMAPRRIIPCSGPVSSKPCCRIQNKQDTKRNVPVVPEVIIWSCRAVLHPSMHWSDQHWEGWKGRPRKEGWTFVGLWHQEQHRNIRYIFSRILSVL